MCLQNVTQIGRAACCRRGEENRYMWDHTPVSIHHICPRHCLWSNFLSCRAIFFHMTNKCLHICNKDQYGIAPQTKFCSTWQIYKALLWFTLFWRFVWRPKSTQKYCLWISKRQIWCLSVSFPNQICEISSQLKRAHPTIHIVILHILSCWTATKLCKMEYYASADKFQRHFWMNQISVTLWYKYVRVFLLKSQLGSWNGPNLWKLAQRPFFTD